MLLGVLDNVAAQTRATGVTREDFTQLKQIVTALAEAQRRTEQRLEELAQAQARTEERLMRVELAVEKLAEAQARSEERFSRVELAVAEHTKAIANLQLSMEQLRKQVGGLSETVGGDIEDIAYIVLYDVLQREFGWQVGVLERS